jgi:acetoin utilization protein AcuB
MYVGWYMKTDLVTISPETTLFRAREMLMSNNISHLPVTDGKAHLVGLVTDRDLKEAWASPATTLSVHELTYVLHKITVDKVMRKEIITATPDMHIERAASILHDHKIGALPVVKDGRLVGIITINDLMEVLLMAVGLGEDTRRFSVLVKDRIGLLAELGRIMQEAEVSVGSVLSIPVPGYGNTWQIMMRVSTDSFDRAVKALENAGYKVLTEYPEKIEAYLQ